MNKKIVENRIARKKLEIERLHLVVEKMEAELKQPKKSAFQEWNKECRYNAVLRFQDGIPITDIGTTETETLRKEGWNGAVDALTDELQNDGYIKAPAGGTINLVEKLREP